MGKRERISNKKIAQVYEKKGGNLTATAAALGLARKTLERWKAQDPALEELLNDTDESLVDYAETKLVESIDGGNLTAIIFFLKTKGKNRGYVERVENDVRGNPFIDLIKSLPEDDNPEDNE